MPFQIERDTGAKGTHYIVYVRRRGRWLPFSRHTTKAQAVKTVRLLQGFERGWPAKELKRPKPPVKQNKTPQRRRTGKR